MELIEYKRHLVNGVLVDPEWVHIGTIFGGSTEHTWIGIVLSEADRAYYIPDTVETKTVEQVKEIQRTKTFKRPTVPNDPHSKIVIFTTEEINQMVDDKLTELGFIS